MEDAENIRTLISQAIKIDYRIYQREKANKAMELFKVVTDYKNLIKILTTKELN